MEAWMSSNFGKFATELRQNLVFAEYLENK